jgi:hypothetical protein
LEVLWLLRLARKICPTKDLGRRTYSGVVAEWLLFGNLHFALRRPPLPETTDYQRTKLPLA